MLWEASSNTYIYMVHNKSTHPEREVLEGEEVALLL